MFIVNISYKVDISEIEPVMAQHRSYVESFIKQKLFFLAGEKVSRTGAVILANVKNMEELYTILNQDPFYARKLANYDVIEFKASAIATNAVFIE